MRGREVAVYPLARKADLLVRELPDEVLVYDETRDKAHCLNQTAAYIWQHCDGRTDVRALTRLLAQATGAPVPEAVVWLALKQLTSDQLLVAPVVLPAPLQRVNRRQLLRTLGLSAAVALPLVTTIIAPTPAQAVTCLGPGAACATSADCCSNACINNVCA